MKNVNDCEAAVQKLQDELSKCDLNDIDKQVELKQKIHEINCEKNQLLMQLREVYMHSYD